MVDKISQNYSNMNVEQLSQKNRVGSLTPDEQALLEKLIKKSMEEETPDVEDVDTSVVETKSMYAELKKMGATVKDVDTNLDGKVSEEELQELKEVNDIFKQTKKEIADLKKNFKEYVKCGDTSELPDDAKEKLKKIENGFLTGSLGTFAGGTLLGLASDIGTVFGPIGGFLVGGAVAIIGFGVYNHKMNELFDEHLGDQVNDIIQKNLGQYIGNNPYVDNHIRELR